MRRILPGRPQSSRQALCTVNWDGLRIVAYISGNTVIVFNGRREILQSLTVDDAGSLYALSIEERSGNIAVSDKSTVYVYQPFGRDDGDLRWTRTIVLPQNHESSITHLSWSSSDELLVAASCMTLWSFAEEDKPQVIWTSKISSPLHIAVVSPDGGLIASCGRHDRVVKIWRRLSYEQDSTRFDVSYLPHPATVTDLSWRTYWHQEQNLDNLLYTYCSDGRVRAWAQAEHHAFCSLQKIVTIDTIMAIQPRRMSMGSVSKSRFSFIIQSKDVARAAERALQTHRNGTDHALEHLIEIANRSPEVCIILDGLGHMSIWGIENAGLKNKAQAEKFNVALVDGVDITLPMQSATEDFTQIHAFANNDMAASLCILVHSYSGQIDWYQGSFVGFFDTAAKASRLQLESSWSGHDSVLDRMVSSNDEKSFLSLTEADQAILWSRSRSGALVRVSEAQADSAVMDATLVHGINFVVFLHDNTLSLWDLRSRKAKPLHCIDLSAGGAKSIITLDSSSESQPIHIAVLHDDNQVHLYAVHLPVQADRGHANDYHKPLSRSGQLTLAGVPEKYTSEVNNASTQNEPGHVVCCSPTGDLKLFELTLADDVTMAEAAVSLSLSIRPSGMIACFEHSYLAIVHEDYRSVSIWNLQQGLYDISYTSKDMDVIQELYWHRLPNGLLLLAIQSSYSVAIVGQQRYYLTKDKPTWKLLQTIATREHSSHVIGALCWLEPCQIALGLGNQIFTFDVGAPAADRPVTSQGSDIQRLQMQNSALAIFTPAMLNAWLQSGGLNVALRCFRMLHDELRFLAPAEHIELDFEQVVTRLIRQSGQQDGSDPDDFDLREVQDQIRNSLGRVSGHQLPVSEQEQVKTSLDITLQLLEHQNSLDTFAMIYFQHFLHLMSKVDQGATAIQQLPWSAIVHATLSQTQEALLHLVLAQIEEHNIKLTWPTARALGIFLFVADQETLRVHLESVARNEYNRNQDDRNPVDCSLYYLALGKKAVLQSLWRRTIGVKEKESTMKLLARNFNEPRWKESALKNAYALLSRRRFEYAAAFFLLGGSLSDAVNVCANQMRDLQLAVAIARVWTGDDMRDKILRRLVDTTIPDLATDTYEARWMMLWACFQTHKWTEALQCITRPIDVLLDSRIKVRTSQDSEGKQDLPIGALSYLSNDPTPLINMYKHVRSRLVSQGAWTSDLANSSQERRFIMRSVNWYLRAGLDWLALELVANWQFVIGQKVETQAVDAISSQQVPEVTQRSALDDWLEPEASTQPNPPISKDGSVSEFEKKPKTKPPPTQFVEPSANSLLDSFGF